MADQSSVGLHRPWTEPVVDEADLWRRSGGQWLTSAGVTVPTRLVRSLVGAASYLDQRGAGLADVVGASGVGVVGERAALAHLPAAGRISCGGATHLLRSADDWVAVTLARPEDVASIPAWLGVDVGDDEWETVRQAVRDEPAAALVARAELLGLACSSVGERSGPDAVLTEQLGDAPPRRLDQLTVVNLASLWAGPLAADVLARMGARVITVESVGRPDGARLMSPFFEALHGRTESVALPLHTDHGRRQLGELLSRVDLVIEGSRRRALEQMGIVARDLIVHGPRLWLSITGHGRESNRIGFGDDAAAAGALVGWIDDEPTFLADAIADPTAGLLAAAALSHLAERGGRWLVDVALARVAATCAPRPDDPRQRPSVEPLRPTARRDRGAKLLLGRDTESVLAEFDITQ